MKTNPTTAIVNAACLLLVAATAMIPSATAQDAPETGPGGTWPPCPIVEVALEFPFVFVYPECIGTIVDEVSNPKT